MLREFDSDFFSSCTTSLGEQVGEISTMKSAIISALGEDSSSEFSNAYLRTQYNSIYSTLSQDNTNIINHQIYLGKRRSFLYTDDTSGAAEINAYLQAFGVLKNNLEQMALAMGQSASALAGGSGLEAIISQDELNMVAAIETELGYVDYNTLMAMSEADRNAYIQQALEIARQYITNNGLPIVPNSRFEIPIAPGVVIYTSCSAYTTVGNDVVAVDYDPVEHSEVVHLMGQGDYSNFDISINTSLEAGVTYTNPIDDNTSTYVTIGVKPVEGVVFVEEGVNAVTTSATYNGQSVSANVTVATGVEISRPAGWVPEEVYVTVPSTSNSYVPNIDAQDVVEGVAVVGTVAVVGYGIYKIVKIAGCTAVGGPFGFLFAVATP